MRARDGATQECNGPGGVQGGKAESKKERYMSREGGVTWLLFQREFHPTGRESRYELCSDGNLGGRIGRASPT